MSTRIVFITLSSALLLANASADTVTLKNGEEYEGTVIRETDEEVVMAVAVTDHITDEKTFRREEIRAVVATPADLLEYKKLVALEVNANSWSPDAYDRAIAACEAFQSRFPKSAHHQQVVNQIRALTREKERVSRNDLKLNGRWYTPAEIRQEAYQINAERLLQQMEALAAQGDPLGALNAFDRLETGYPGAAAYPRAIAQARGLIARVQAEVARDVPAAKHRQAKFEEEIGFTPEPERSRVLAIHQKTMEQAEAAFRRSTAKWKPIHLLIDESVTALLETARGEMSRLSVVDTGPMNESVRLTDAGRELLRQRKPDEALSRLDQAAKLWSANEAAPRLRESAREMKATLLAEEAAREKAEIEAARLREVQQEQTAPDAP